MFKQTETTMHVSNLQKSREKWKEKAKKKTKEANRLRKEKKRLQQSCAHWKEKYKQRNSTCLTSRNISRHSYNSFIITICLCLKLYAQQSVRGISKSIEVWIIVLGLAGKSPSHTTIHTWLRKSGYYRLTHPKEESNAQWVLFLDESVCIGREKLLLIMGVDIREVHQGNISFLNSRCLYLSSRNSWKGENIAEGLESIKEKLHGQIRFAVADRGNNIGKGLKLAEIPYIHDLTHEMALCLAQIYEKAEDFKAYMKWAALLRRQLVLSNQAHLMPPEQRAKARFHNIEPLYKWGRKIEASLSKWQHQDKSLYERYKKVREFNFLLNELGSILSVIGALKKMIYNGGIRRSLMPDIYKLLAGLKDGRPSKFSQKMSHYFKESYLRLGKQNIPICCSDIIESAFGKFKLMMSENKVSGITDLALVIPAFMGNNWGRNQVKEAFEQVKVKDYKEWSSNNMEDSLLKKRKKVFKNWNKLAP